MSNRFDYFKNDDLQLAKSVFALRVHDGIVQTSTIVFKLQRFLEGRYQDQPLKLTTISLEKDGNPSELSLGKNVRSAEISLGKYVTSAFCIPCFVLHAQKLLIKSRFMLEKLLVKILLID